MNAEAIEAPARSEVPR
uniref:Uncharacterized protein n=1 Tax=Setaria italica TaxID=4555 RepID=K3XRT3_SETIT